MKCSICGVKLNKTTLGLKNMLNKKEQKRLEKVRRSNGVCSECSITMLLLDLQ